MLLLLSKLLLLMISDMSLASVLINSIVGVSADEMLLPLLNKPMSVMKNEISLATGVVNSIDETASG